MNRSCIFVMIPRGPVGPNTLGPSMIPIKTIVIEQVRRDTSSVKQAYVKLACNRVILPSISYIACESVETAIRTFMFGCLFSIFHHAFKNVSLIENTDQHSACN